MEGILFSNIEEIVKNKEVISDIQTNEHWCVMPYEIERVHGKALITTDIGRPADLVLAPKLTGWHKIFVCSVRMTGSFRLHIRFDNEKHYTVINNSSQPPNTNWWHNERAEEIFWCCADMTDREIILEKHKSYNNVTTLIWLRCVPMTEEEVAAYKDYVNADGRRNLHVHYDNDTNVLIGADSIDDLLIKNYAVKDSDVKICTQEIMDDTYDEEAYDEHDRCIWQHEIRYNAENKKTAAIMDELVKARADLMHGMGIKLYAGYRASVALSSPPFAPLMLWSFVKKHPEYHCYTRDGRKTSICSYAYPEVRQYSIDYIKRAVKRGYDGVSLIAHRGIRSAFEQPVLDEFAKRHDGLDARRVPLNDPRLTEIWCEYFTQFVRDLRDQLDEMMGKHVPINVITGYCPEASKHLGVDIEALCKEGLIDHFCVDAMDIYEYQKTEEYFAEDGLIDLEKYTELLHDKYLVYRRFGDAWNLFEQGIPQFMEIAEKYGVEYFIGMSPEGGNAQKRLERIEKLRSMGVKSFSFFNFCHSCHDRTVVHATTKTGHEPNLEYITPNFYRVLAYDDIDMSTFVPSWRA